MERRKINGKIKESRRRRAGREGDLRDGLDHVHAHLYTAVGVVSPGLRKPRHTVVAVSQNLNTQAVVLLG